MFSERWVPIAAGVGVFLFLFGLMPPEKIPLWVVNLTGVSAEDASEAHGGVELTFRVEYDFELDPDHAIEQVVDVLRERVKARGLDGASVRRDGDRVIVRLPEVADEAAHRMREMMTRAGRLEFRVVQHDAEPMRIPSQRAQYQGVDVMPESWSTDRMGEVRDYYMTAPTREELEAVLTPLADDVVFFGYEFVKLPDFGSRPEGATDYWRSYALRRTPYLDSGAVSDADLSYNEVTNQPEVAVHFSDYGAEQFTQMTEDYTGYKLAIILDDEIKSAPVIQERIPGGTAIVHMGYGAEPAVLEARARDLAAVLSAGTLKSPVVLDNEELIPPKLSEAKMWTARALFALMIGLLVGGAVFGAQQLAPRFRR